MRTTDPKTFAETVGGRPGDVAKLGIVYREPVRW